MMAAGDGIYWFAAARYDLEDQRPPPANLVEEITDALEADFALANDVVPPPVPPRIGEMDDLKMVSQEHDAFERILSDIVCIGHIVTDAEI